MILILLVLLIVGVSTAPVRELESQRSNSHDDQEVYKTLKEGLLNDTSNLENIKTAFKVKPGQVKICISFIYCLYNDQGNCNNTGIIWTNFDASSLSGRFLYYFAVQNLSIFGFEWAGACDIDSDIYLDIKTSSYEDQYKYINDSLIKLTQQVRVVSLNH